MQAGGSDAINRLGHLHAQRVSRDRGRAQRDAQEQPVRLGKDDARDGKQPTKRSELKQGSAWRDGRTKARARPLPGIAAGG